MSTNINELLKALLFPPSITVGTESLKITIYFVQQLSAALAPNFKMAAFMSVEEVREMVSRDEEMVIHAEELTNDEATLTDEIKECLRMVGNSNIDFDFFVDAGVSPT